MKPKTKTTLSELSKTQSRASLIRFRKDLVEISEAEFLELLDGFFRKKPKRSVKKSPGRTKKAGGPVNDKPVTRIAFVLRSLSLADARAASKLKEALLATGVRPASVPPISEPLERWLDELLSSVPDSKVMVSARRLAAELA